jgi:phospholipid/cholesterol/gamma-HCH transport system substrate-binding protein
MQHLPQLSDSVASTMKNLNAVLSPENRQHFTAIMANLDTLSTTIATHQQEIGDAITHLDQTTQQLSGISTNLNQLLVDNRVPLTVALKNIGKTAATLSQVADQLDQMIAEDRAGLKQFSNGTLYQLGGLVVDTRRMVHRANDTLDMLDRNPSSFLFGSRSEGIPAK